MDICLSHPLDKFKHLQIPYPFYCIDPIISNDTKEYKDKYSGRFIFTLIEGCMWKKSTTDSYRREFLFKHAIKEVDHYFTNIDINREVNEENALRDAGKLFTGGVRI